MFCNKVTLNLIIANLFIKYKYILKLCGNKIIFVVTYKITIM